MGCSCGTIVGASSLSVGDEGVSFEFTFLDEDAGDPNSFCDPEPIDISEATDMKVVFLPPSGVAVEKDLSFFTDGEDGIASYESEAGLLVEDGIWRAQARLTINGGTHRAPTVSFTVKPALA